MHKWMMLLFFGGFILTFILQFGEVDSIKYHSIQYHIDFFIEEVLLKMTKSKNLDDQQYKHIHVPSTFDSEIVLSIFIFHNTPPNWFPVIMSNPTKRFIIGFTFLPHEV